MNSQLCEILPDFRNAIASVLSFLGWSLPRLSRLRLRAFFDHEVSDSPPRPHCCAGGMTAKGETPGDFPCTFVTSTSFVVLSQHESGITLHRSALLLSSAHFPLTLTIFVRIPVHFCGTILHTRIWVCLVLASARYSKSRRPQPHPKGGISTLDTK